MVAGSLCEHSFSTPSLFPLPDGGRLRLDNDQSGLGPPLYENQTLAEAGVERGQTVVVETGPAPLNSELPLLCALFPPRADGREWEVIVGRSVSVGECCRKMVETAGLEGEHVSIFS